jgi:hypothetical protein
VIRALASDLERAFFAPAPARRLASLRVLTGAFCVIHLLVRVRALADFGRLSPERFEPVGVVRVLAEPLAPSLVWCAWASCVALAIAFTLGYRFRITGPAFAVLLLWVTSYRNSWGMIFHTENLMVLHVAVLSLTPAGAALSRGGAREAAIADHGRFGWPIRLIWAVTVATYFIAGLAKLRLTGLDWIDGEVLRSHLAHDAIRKIQIGSVHSAFGLWLARYDWPARILSPFTLLLELGAPLALCSRRIAVIWAIGAWSFHVGVLATMAIAFVYPISGVGFAALTPVERIWEWRGLRRAGRWLTGPQSAEPVAGTPPSR